jgi:microcystin-dependent protein
MKRRWVVWSIVLVVLGLGACGPDRIGHMMEDAGSMLVDAQTADAQVDPAEIPGVPIGTVLAFAGAQAPEGWLACDGAEVGREDYPELFRVVGVAHGQGDGASTFHMPDYRGRFLRGVDDGAGRDPEAALREPANDGGARGDRVGSVQSWATGSPEVPFSTTEAGAHAHELTRYGTHMAAGGTSFPTTELDNPQAPGATGTAGAHTHTITGGDAETRPENAAVLYIVRAR